VVVTGTVVVVVFGDDVVVCPGVVVVVAGAVVGVVVVDGTVVRVLGNWLAYATSPPVEATATTKVA